MQNRWLTLLILGATATAQTGTPTRDDLALFEWFDKSGYTDPTARKVVEITTKTWWSNEVRPTWTDKEIALVLEERSDEIRVLSPQLRGFTVKRAKRDPFGPTSQVEFRAIALEVVAKRHLASIRGDREEDPFAGSDGSLRPAVETTTIAWFCHKNNLRRLAAELMQAARQMPFDRRGIAADLNVAVKREIGHSAFWRLILDFQDASVSYEELLARHERYVRRFPHERHVERAKANIAVLRRMVREAKKHAQPPKPLEGKTRVAELIYELRTQNGVQSGQPGGVSIWYDDRKEQSPAHQLLKLDYAAVPALIEAMDDDTFTRQVAYVRDFHFSHHVLRVGDCAWRILESITGKEFHDPGYFSETPSSEKKSKEVKVAATKWWQHVQKVGRRSYLIEGVKKGDESSPNLASQLLDRFPDAAFEAIREAHEKSESDWAKPILLGQLTRTAGEAAKEHFARLLRSEKADEQFAGMVGLARRSDMRGLPIAVARLLKKPVHDLDDEAVDRARRRGTLAELVAPKGDANREYLIVFLATCGDASAWSTLDKLELSARDIVLQAIDPKRDDPGLFSFDRGSLSLPPVPLTNKGWNAAAERFCVQTIERALAEPWTGRKLLEFDGEMARAAAVALANRRPDRYSIGGHLPLFATLRRAHEMSNAWRANEASKPLPTPNWLRLPPKGEAEIARVHFLEGSKKMSTAWRQRLEALLGKDLRSAAPILELLRAKRPSSRCIQLVLSRPAKDRKLVLFAQCHELEGGKETMVTARAGTRFLGALFDARDTEKRGSGFATLQTEWPKLAASEVPWEARVQIAER